MAMNYFIRFLGIDSSMVVSCIILFLLGRKTIWKPNAVRIVINYNVSGALSVAVVDALLSAIYLEVGNLGAVRSLTFRCPQLLLIMWVITPVCIPKINHISRK